MSVVRTAAPRVASGDGGGLDLGDHHGGARVRGAGPAGALDSRWKKRLRSESQVREKHASCSASSTLMCMGVTAGARDGKRTWTGRVHRHAPILLDLRRSDHLSARALARVTYGNQTGLGPTARKHWWRSCRLRRGTRRCFRRRPHQPCSPSSYNTEVRLIRCDTRQRSFESADGGGAARAALVCVEQLVPVLGRPSARGGQRLQRAAAQRCQRVLHPQFRVGVHRA